MEDKLKKLTKINNEELEAVSGGALNVEVCNVKSYTKEQFPKNYCSNNLIPCQFYKSEHIGYTSSGYEKRLHRCIERGWTKEYERNPVVL